MPKNTEKHLLEVTFHDGMLTQDDEREENVKETINRTLVELIAKKNDAYELDRVEDRYATRVRYQVPSENLAEFISALAINKFDVAYPVKAEEDEEEDKSTKKK